jgi:hypothetical protein
VNFATWTPTIGTWYHIAVVRYGNQLKTYVNGVHMQAYNNAGVLLGDYYDVTGLNLSDVGTDGIGIGGQPYNLTGVTNCSYMDEFRVSKGIARWTADFSPWAYPYGSEPANMTLQSVTTVPATTPDMARIIVFEEDIDAVTLNTDLLAYVSRDNGVTWSQVTLVDEGDYSGTKRILSGIVDMKSLAPVLSSYNMKYKLMTSSKYMNIRGVSMNW